MSTLRGQRHLPISRGEEFLALRSIERAIGDGGTRREVEVQRGRILARPSANGARLALWNRAGHRVAVAQVSGMKELHLARTLAEVLHQARGLADGRPDVNPWTVGNVMRMRRNQGCPVLRADGTIRMGVPGAHAVVDSHSITVISDTGPRIRLVLEGEWEYCGAARVADAMLRDLAPEARHLTYTTTPRGWHLNGYPAGKRNGGSYDGASTAYCSCGWFSMEGDQASARASAAWHRENPHSYRPA